MKIKLIYLRLYYSHRFITTFIKCRSSPPEVFCKKDVLRNFAKFTGKHPCQSLFLNKVADPRSASLSKESLAQVFFCEFCEISKNTVFKRTLPVVASGNDNLYLGYWQICFYSPLHVSKFCYQWGIYIDLSLKKILSTARV